MIIEGTSKTKLVKDFKGITNIIGIIKIWEETKIAINKGL